MPANDDARIAESVTAIRRVAPLIAASRDTFDRDRRLPDAVFRALAEAGLFRLWLPDELQGPAFSPIAL